MTLSTSRHVTSSDVASYRRRRRCGHVLASLRQHLPEINRLGKHQRFTIFKFEIVFFQRQNVNVKTDKLKSVFKLRLASLGRKLWPILVLLYFLIN